MARGDTERAFSAAAAADGIALARGRVSWLNQRGQLGLPDEADPVRRLLHDLFVSLGGDPIAQAGKSTRPLPGDFVHEPTGTFIEVDEHQHFTSYRRRTLGAYPSDAQIGFDLDEYRELCRDWAPRADRYYRNKPATGFGPGGRQRQRAYHDALRDIVTPALGRPPVIRVAAPERDGTLAYRRVRDRMVALI